MDIIMKIEERHTHVTKALDEYHPNQRKIRQIRQLLGQCKRNEMNVHNQQTFQSEQNAVTLHLSIMTRAHSFPRSPRNFEPSRGIWVFPSRADPRNLP